MAYRLVNTAAVYTSTNTRHTGAIGVSAYRHIDWSTLYNATHLRSTRYTGAIGRSAYSAYRHIGRYAYYIDWFMPGAELSRVDESSAAPHPLCPLCMHSAYRHIGISICHHRVQSWAGHIDMRGMPIRQYAGMSADVSTY
jgi:hypothetical protein